jgi:two-component system sensor histidine kinase VicK
MLQNFRLFCNREKEILIEADKGKLTQVICNILSNAIKFTEDATININVEKKLIISTGNNDNENRQGVIINIKDTGVGIDSQIFPKLFSKFMGTSDTRGSGLGLFISKSIVEAHGGRIWAENNPDGRGATFSFNLPIIK